MTSPMQMLSFHDLNTLRTPITQQKKKKQKLGTQRNGAETHTIKV